MTFQEKYDAVARKDISYEGLFYTCVKTTGIFCRPGCTARLPKPQNVEFHNTPQEAIRHGFRPCKVCRPMEEAGKTPDYIASILKELEADPMLNLKDQDLRERGVEPSQIRRWFKKHHQMTFHAYQRMLRINNAYSKLSAGASVTETAFDSGYESLSGFNERFKSIFQGNPSEAKGKAVIHIRRFTTPLGPMYGCATEQGVCLAEFTDRRMLETEFKDLRKRLDAVILPGPNPHLDQLVLEMGEYFAGKRKVFEVPLHTPTTDFRQAVWDLLVEIPYGKTRSYKRQAELLGKPTAVRAVGSANGHNRISIVIPCHRVIGEDGTLTGYGGGLGRKRWLLDFERENAGKD